eukprot:5388503-Amphidinium_carterae.1
MHRFGARDNISLVLNYVTPANLTTVLRDALHAIPHSSVSPDLLKVDLDHADCHFMAAALRVVHPKLIHFEYLPPVPPPMSYAQENGQLSKGWGSLDYQPRLLQFGLDFRASAPLQEVNALADAAL